MARSHHSRPFSEEHRAGRYGISDQEYRALHSLQGGRCAICGRVEYIALRGRPRALAVDHDHASGHVRALLCMGCNVGLGAFGDDPDRLRAAIAYLERPAA